MTTKQVEVGANWITNPNRDLRAIEDEFDEAAPLYEDKALEWNYRAASDGASWFSKLAALDDRILDLGCGTGLVGAELAARGFRNLCGCDISERMLNIARIKGVYTDGLYRADLCSTPFANASFDSLICIAVLTYAPSIDKVMREFNRLTRSGGLVCFSHRVDLEDQCGFRSVVERMTATNTWRHVKISEPQLYYPDRADYADRILVKYYTFMKIEQS